MYFFILLNPTSNKYFNWLKAIINAASEVNPLITGFDKKSTRDPNLKMPNSACKTPIIKARRITNSIKYSELISAKVTTYDATIRASMATGQTASLRKVPKIRYAIYKSWRYTIHEQKSVTQLYHEQSF